MLPAQPPPLVAQTWLARSFSCLHSLPLQPQGLWLWASMTDSSVRATHRPSRSGCFSNCCSAGSSSTSAPGSSERGSAPWRRAAAPRWRRSGPGPGPGSPDWLLGAELFTLVLWTLKWASLIRACDPNQAATKVHFPIPQPSTAPAHLQPLPFSSQYFISKPSRPAELLHSPHGLQFSPHSWRLAASCSSSYLCDHRTLSSSDTRFISFGADLDKEVSDHRDKGREENGSENESQKTKTRLRHFMRPR